jgi:hypothetical protein
LCLVDIIHAGISCRILEHSFEITPHYDSAEDSINCAILP